MSLACLPVSVAGTLPRRTTRVEPALGFASNAPRRKGD